jgi:hypothetical protein
MLGARHQLMTMHSELDAQVRGILTTFGLILGAGKGYADPACRGTRRSASGEKRLGRQVGRSALNRAPPGWRRMP